VAGIDHDAVRRALAVALVSFGTDIGATVVASGVETADEYAAVREIGFHYAQGHFVGRPMPLHQAPIPLEHLQR
jgi:EAL domain-containing protein (putative c-di-GMP-specific phosphodiesterase class I)